MTPLDKCVIRRIARTRADVRWLVAVARDADRARDEGVTPVYRPMRDFRLSLGQVVLAQMHARPAVVMYVIGGAALYGVAVVSLVYKHFH